MLHQIHDRAEFLRLVKHVKAAFDVSNNDGRSHIDVMISRGCVYEHHGCIFNYDCITDANVIIIAVTIILFLRVHGGVLEWIYVCVEMRTRL